MIKTPKLDMATSIIVRIKKGGVFENKNVPPSPLASPGYISFWMGTTPDVLRVYSLDDVEYYGFGFESDS